MVRTALVLICINSSPSALLAASLAHLNKIVRLVLFKRKSDHISLLLKSSNWVHLTSLRSFPGGSDGKESPCNTGNPCSVPGWGRSPGEGNGNPLQYSCLENSMDRGTWQGTVHGITKSWTQLSDYHSLKLLQALWHWAIHFHDWAYFPHLCIGTVILSHRFFFSFVLQNLLLFSKAISNHTSPTVS